MGFQNLKTEEIKIEISKRQALIIEIINFIEILTLREIDYIQGFSFIVDTGQTDFSEEEYTVKYHSRVVFSVRSQSAGNYQVYNFDENVDWQNKLEDLIEHAKTLLWEFERKEELKKKKFEDKKKRKEEKKKRKSLLEEAKRLKLL